MKKRTYGWKPELPDMRDHMVAFRRRAAALPTRVDLRPNCPPVYDQGSIGSCTANAAAAAFQFDQMKQGVSEFTPSRLFIYYNERVLDGDVRQDAGSQLRTAAKTLNKTGVCPETLWPYIVSKFTRKPVIKAYRAAKKSVSYASLNNARITDLKSSLADGIPFIFGFTVYESFESDVVAQTGMVPMPTLQEGVLGGHAVMCVGYDDTKKCFIVRNSWGPDWGDKGYCYMPYAYLTNSNLATDFWQIITVAA